ncbi:hypothetical protein [Streptomyces anulatus]|uniref:hypothetical protein n=1 Tax=Streptomyces anulatus TaxID=1892 RepID=UPI002F90C2F4|nr:hypothetical protein OHA54_39775 [Streptomyces anulatus]WTE08544.1 hypothetical protein OH765_38960 [Streptomyces anulatus]
MTSTSTSQGPSPAWTSAFCAAVTARSRDASYAARDRTPTPTHARTAAHHDPDTAALVGYSTTTPLTLPTAAALLCSLHDPEELADMSLRLVRHITRTTAATQHRDPVVLELSDAPEEAGR